MLSGFYEEKTHNVIDYQDCALQDVECNKILATIKEMMINYAFRCYN